MTFRKSCQQLVSGDAAGLLTVWRPTELSGSTDELSEESDDGDQEDDWT